MCGGGATKPRLLWSDEDNLHQKIQFLTGPSEIKRTPCANMPSSSLSFSWQISPHPHPSAGARSGGSQSANLPSICPPPQCQRTPAIPHQDSSGWGSPNLFPLPSPILPHTHQYPPLAFLLPETPVTSSFVASSLSLRLPTSTSLISLTLASLSDLFSPHTLHSSAPLLPNPQLSSLFLSAPTDMMAKDRCRHARSQEPGHINQRHAAEQLRVRSMHHSLTAFTLPFIGLRASKCARMHKYVCTCHPGPVYNHSAVAVHSLTC